MSLEQWSEQIVVVHLADDPQFSEDIESLDAALGGTTQGAVLDFSAITFLNSSNLSSLLSLRKNFVVGQKKRLVFCGVPPKVWTTFVTTGIDKLFPCVDNVLLALATLQMEQTPQT